MFPMTVMLIAVALTGAIAIAVTLYEIAHWGLTLRASLSSSRRLRQTHRSYDDATLS